MELTFPLLPLPVTVITKSLNSENSMKQNSISEMEENSPPNNVTRSRVKEKVVHVCSACSIILITFMLTRAPWLMAYYYAVTLPILMIIRAVTYSKYKWQFFLLDYCYFANLVTYIFIWALPWQPEFSAVVFGICNGPLPWASIVFRNSLVLHSVDKVTSVFIHLLPSILTFCIRWYPVESSLRWYTAFNEDYNESVEYLFIWVAAVPFACYVFHTCFYTILLHAVCRPGDEYSHSYAYLVQSGCTSNMLNSCGKKHSLLLYVTLQTIFGALSCLVTPLFYKFYFAHLAFLCVIFVAVNFNGSTFYVRFLQEKALNDAS